MVGSTTAVMEPVERLIHVDHEYVKTADVLTDCIVEVATTTETDNIDGGVILDNSSSSDTNQFLENDVPAYSVMEDISSADDAENNNLLSSIMQEAGITPADASPDVINTSGDEEVKTEISSGMEDSLHNLLEELGAFVNHEYLQMPSPTSNVDCSDTASEPSDSNSLASPLICAGTTCKTLENFSNEDTKSNATSCETTDSVQPHSPGLLDFDYLPSSSPLYSDNSFDIDKTISNGSTSPKSVDLMLEDDLWQESFGALFPTLSF